MDIQLPQILFQIINFGVVAGALTYFLYKPVKQVLDDRAKKVEEGQKAAEQNIAEKHQLDEMKRKAVKDAEKEATALLEEANQSAAAKRKELLAKAKEEADAEIAKMKAAWTDEKAGIIADVKKEFSNAVVATVEKVFGAMDKKSHAKLIDQSLEQLLEKI
jgi:F-type H+-transporting ATPase subunit b